MTGRDDRGRTYTVTSQTKVTITMALLGSALVAVATMAFRLGQDRQRLDAIESLVAVQGTALTKQAQLLHSLQQNQAVTAELLRHLVEAARSPK